MTYAYLYPGMNKVLQSAGRVIRTEKDKGVILLMDERFQSPHYRKMFPREWSDCRRCTMENVTELLQNFGKKIPPDPEMCPGNRADRMQEGMRLILPPDSSSNGLLFHRMEATQKFLRCLGKRELLIVCDDQRTLRHLFVHIQGEDTVRFFGDTVIRIMQFRVRCVQGRSEDRCLSAQSQEQGLTDAAGTGGGEIHWWYCSYPA